MKTAEQWAKEMPAPLGEVFLIERGWSGYKSQRIFNTMHEAITAELWFIKTRDERFWRDVHDGLLYNSALPRDWLKRTLHYKRKLDAIIKRHKQWSSTLPLAC